MAAEDYIVFDWYPEEGKEAEPYTVACKYCGTRELVWEDIEYGWKLFEPSGKQHYCKKSQ